MQEWCNKQFTDQNFWIF